MLEDAINRQPGGIHGRVSVNHRRLQTFMAEQFLDDPHVHPLLSEGVGKAMPERMWPEDSFKPAGLHLSEDCALNRSGMQMPPHLLSRSRMVRAWLRCRENEKPLF